VGIARRAFSPCFSSCLEPGFGIGLHRSAPYEFNCAPDVGNDLQFAEEWLRFFLSEIRDLEGCGLLPSPVSESERPGAPSSWLDSTPRPGPPASERHTSGPPRRKHKPTSQDRDMGHPAQKLHSLSIKPRCAGSNPWGKIVPESYVAPVKSAPSRIAFVKSTPINLRPPPSSSSPKRAPVKSAFRKLAWYRNPNRRSAFTNLHESQFVSLRDAPYRSAPLKSEFCRSDSLNEIPSNSIPARKAF